MKTLILYYSNSGTTHIVSKTLAIHLDADIIRIKDLKKREGFGNRLLSSINAFRETKTKISPSKIDLTDYDTIYIGTPTWSGNPTPAIITLIDSCNLKGKDVILFATMSNNRGQTNIERLEEKVKMRGARVIETFTVKTKDKTPEQLINDTETIIQMLDLKMYNG